MNPAVTQMLQRYSCESRLEYERALKEILQELALIGLWRAKFFEHAAFYGGTALRILYGLDRFSEDLDFTLLTPSSEFSLEPYNKAIQAELSSFGFTVEVDTKSKVWATPIRSAFIKTRALGELLRIGVPKSLMKGFHPETQLKIKLEVDTDPASAYGLETRFLTRPFAVGIRAVTLESIFAGKMHALLYREWKGRVKGRDWYDWLWLVQRGASLKLSLLAAHMRHAGSLAEGEDLSRSRFEEILLQRIETVDIDSARDDMRAFAVDRAQFEGWSRELFRDALHRTPTH